MDPSFLKPISPIHGYGKRVSDMTMFSSDNARRFFYGMSPFRLDYIGGESDLQIIINNNNNNNNNSSSSSRNSPSIMEESSSKDERDDEEWLKLSIGTSARLANDPKRNNGERELSNITISTQDESTRILLGVSRSQEATIQRGSIRPPFPISVGPVSSSSGIRVIPPPRRPHSGLWFMLLASQTREIKEEVMVLPQISKSYLRIKDGKMTIRVVIKYLANKLRLENESDQIEIRCKGQRLVPSLTLQHVRDNIWSNNSQRDFITLLPNSSTTHHIMVLHYAKSPSN